MFSTSNSTGLAVVGVGALLFTWIASYILKTIKRNQFITANKCQAVPKYPQSETIIGYGLYKAISNSLKDNTSLQGHLDRVVEMKQPGCDSVTYHCSVITQPLMNTTEPENIKAVLATKFADYGIGSRLKFFGPLLGKGIFTADGAHWEHSRALVRPSFTKTQLMDLDTLEGHVQSLIRGIPSDGRTFDIQPLFFNLTVDHATEFLLGESIHSQAALQAGKDAKFAEYFDYAQMEVRRRVMLGPLYFLYRNEKFDTSCKNVKQFVERFVDKAIEHRKNMIANPEKEKEIEASGKQRYVFLDELSKTTLDPATLRDESLNVLLAGRDTTAGVLTHIFHALSRHPEAWKALKKEVDALDGIPPDYEALKNMVYLRAVINETLRLWPSVPINSRYAVTDTVLPRGGGPDGQSPVFVPKGTAVVYSVWIVHRRKDIYGEDADEFRPERWLKDGSGASLRPGWGFLPFNGGPRICLGQQFALTNVSYTTVRLLQQFSTIESRDSSPWTEAAGVTLASANGAKIAFKA